MANGLVLGSGGIRGIAHIALIQELTKKKNLKFDIVTGCSAGSVIGGMYALDPDADMVLKKINYFMKAHTKFFDGLSKELSSKLRGFAKLLTDTGIVANNKAYNLFKELYGNKKFSDCKIKFGIVTVDIDNGRIEEITEGYLIDAIMASSNVPAAFTPLRLGGMNLVDGAVLSEVPVYLAKKLGADYTVAHHVSPLPVKTKFEDGMDYMAQLNNLKINILTNIEFNQADEKYVYSGTYDWYQFNNWLDIYNEAKILYKKEVN